MSSSTTTPADQVSLLQPMDLHNPAEFDELLRQRIICGWENTPSTLESWRTSADAKILSTFWVVPASLSTLPTPQRWAGHISMVAKTEGPENTPICHIANLFILPEHRHGGLGRKAVEAVEAWAKDEGCTRMTLNAISRRYVEDDAPEWRGFYVRLCESLRIEIPKKGTTNEDWYVRQGYVKYDEKPSYPAELDGEKTLLIASYLRKELV